MSDNEKKEYEALAVPEEALTHGGVELVRVIMTDDKFYLSARPALKDPAEWGEILAELTRRLGLLYDMGDTGFAEQDVVVAIEEAYAAEMGAKGGKPRKKPATKRKSAKRKPAARKLKRAPPTKTARKTAKRKKR